MLESKNRQSPTRAALQEIGVMPMFESTLFAAAAVATIAGFILEVWREMKSKVQKDDEGRKKKGRS